MSPHNEWMMKPEATSVRNLKPLVHEACRWGGVVVSLCPHIHTADSITQEFKEFTSIQELEGILCAGMEEGWQVFAAHVCRSTHEVDAPP